MSSIFTEEDIKFFNELKFDSTKIVLDKGLDVIRRIKNGTLVPLLTGINAENKSTLGFFPSDQIVIAGRSGMGKTSRVLAWIDDFINPDINPFYANKIIILYNSWEMSAWRNAIKLLSGKAKKTSQELLDYNTRLTDEKLLALETLAAKYYDKPLFINETSLTAKTWEATVEKISRRFKNHTIVNITDHTRLVTAANEFSEEALITSLMKSGMKVKNKFETINIFLSQMNRNIENNAHLRNREGKIGNILPQASDIFGADSVQQFADIIFALQRPGYYGEVEYKDAQGNTINTELTSAVKKDDHLLLEVILKNRNNAPSILPIRHDIKFNEFREYNEHERNTLFRNLNNYRIT